MPACRSASSGSSSRRRNSLCVSALTSYLSMSNQTETPLDAAMRRIGNKRRSACSRPSSAVSAVRAGARAVTLTLMLARGSAPMSSRSKSSSDGQVSDAADRVLTKVDNRSPYRSACDSLWVCSPRRSTVVAVWRRHRSPTTLASSSGVSPAMNWRAMPSMARRAIDAETRLPPGTRSLRATPAPNQAGRATPSNSANR